MKASRSAISSSRASRVWAVLLIFVLVAAACSRPEGFETGDGGDLDTGIDLGDLGPVTPDQPTQDDADAEAAAETIDVAPADQTGADPSSDPGTAPPPAGPGSPGGPPPASFDDDQAKAVGDRIRPQSTERRQPFYAGVGDKTITVVASRDATSCGVNVIDAITAAGGALPTDGRFYRGSPTNQSDLDKERVEAITTLFQYFNDTAFEAADYLPHIRPLMGNDPKHQFYGRRLDVKFVDGGSNQCPEKQTAAAKSAVDDHKAFAVFNDFDGAQFNMANALSAVPAARRPMHFGTLWLSDSIYTQLAPYVWTQFSTGTTIVRQYASYICSRVRTGKVPGRSPMVTDPTKRVFGLVHTNKPEDKRLADELKAYLKQFCGLTNIKEVEYEGVDFGKAQQDNTNVVVQLKLANVTTVMMLTEPIQPLFQIAAAKQQDYFPEWVFSSFGYGDSNTVMRLYDQDEMKGAFGTTNLGVYGGFGFGAGDPFEAYHRYHKKSPNTGKPCDPTSDAGMDHDPQYCKAPGSIVTWYYTVLPSIGGIIFAGPDLTPQNVSKGLQAYPKTRFGGNGPTTDPRPALVGAGAGRYGFIVDATEWRWRPEFTDPSPKKKKGWIEYPDCMRHYLQWPDQLAPNWETNGPNYNAWCGDKNGYPRVLDSDKQR